MPADAFLYDLLLHRQVAQTVIGVPGLRPKFIPHLRKAVISVIGETDPVPGFRIFISRHLFLAICLPYFIALEIIPISGDTVEDHVFFLTDTDTFPALQPQAIVLIKMFCPFAVRLPYGLPMAVVTVTVGQVPVWVFDPGQATHGVIGIGISGAVICFRVIRLWHDLFYQVAVRVVKPALTSPVCVKDPDLVAVPVVFIPCPFPVLSSFLVAYRVDLTGDVPIKITK